MSFQVIITPEFERAVIRQASRIIEEKLFTVREIIIGEFGGAKTGRIYRRPRGGSYQASAPSQPPAIRSGELLRSISQPKVGRSGRFLVGVLEIAALYAGFLERGTGRMAPRPFIGPAIRELLRRRA